MKILFLGEKTNPVYKWLLNNNEEVISITKKINLEFVKNGNFEFIISYGYRYIISQEIILFMKEKIINLHISLLPYNRGADPNFWSYLENTPKGVTIHLIDKGIDTGDIIVQKEIDIDEDKHSLKTSYNLLNIEIQNLFFTYWKKIKHNKIIPKKQLVKGSYHSSKDKNEYTYLLNENGWNTNCKKIANENIKLHFR